VSGQDSSAAGGWDFASRLNAWLPSCVGLLSLLQPLPYSLPPLFARLAPNSYDDINESMAHTGVVRLALRDLRVRGEQIVRGEVNEAYNTVTRLGYRRGRAETHFDPQVAADWWRSNVFVKTYRERRSWLAVFRAYYRVYAWHLVLYHAMQAQAFVGWVRDLRSSSGRDGGLKGANSTVGIMVCLW
jgi:hypothetical protein